MYMAEAPEYLLKVILVGADKVGKSSLLLRYVQDTFDPTYLSTIGECNSTMQAVLLWYIFSFLQTVFQLMSWSGL